MISRRTLFVQWSMVRHCCSLLCSMDTEGATERFHDVPVTVISLTQLVWKLWNVEQVWLRDYVCAS